MKLLNRPRELWFQLILLRLLPSTKDIAMGNMKSYGIPASIILAQGILESGAGRGDLADRK
jgi:flagellum-specific peptidoglycan hydrolase FlgJ